MFKGLSYGRAITKDRALPFFFVPILVFRILFLARAAIENLLHASYADPKGALAEILTKPNPTGASQLLSVNWGGKTVDPHPYDNRDGIR
jgi:hypothetical protein